MSVTIAAKLFVEGAVEGVQENWPEIGLIEAPGGDPEPRLKNRVCGGLSLSEAWAVKFTDLPRTTVRLVIGARTGCQGGPAARPGPSGIGGASASS